MPSIRISNPGILVGVVLAAGCGAEERTDVACSPGTADGCRMGLVCEKQGDTGPSCFAPVVAHGRVVDLASGEGIAGATVIALGADGKARSRAAITDGQGNYAVPVPADRKPGGEPLEDLISLQVAAAGYQGFPIPPREPMLIDLSVAGGMLSDPAGPDPLVIASSATVIGLASLAVDTTRYARIAGKLEHQLAPGTSIVAVQQLRAVSTAIVDLAGAFTLFDVPPGSTQLEAYRSGLWVEPVTILTEPGERRTGLQLSPASGGLARVAGSVTFVNAPSHLTTSVALVLDSTFEQVGPFARGVVPAGLRTTNIRGAFAIEAVPPGKYAVLAASENDQAVRDPEQSMSGMDVAHVEVTEDGLAVEVSQALNITAALPVQAPGASGFEHVLGGEDVSLSWAADPDADGYEVRVFDGFGAVVLEALNVTGQEGAASVNYGIGSDELLAGVPYQFRAVSWRGGSDRDTRTYLRATEDLRGTFQVEPESP